MIKRKRIYVAYTGGTIGMKPSAKGFVPAPGFLTKTLKDMPEFYRSEMPEFVIEEYPQLLDSSEPMARNFFEKLIVYLSESLP